MSMQQLGALLRKVAPAPGAKLRSGEPNSPRAEQVARILVLMGEDATLPEERALELRQAGSGRAAKKQRLSRRFKYWLGRTRRLHPGDIYRLLRCAGEGSNPPALFNYLLRKECPPLHARKNNHEKEKTA